uniref:Uncharacterized protein n=1 Tax=Arion vulgaris TaxID=1028688 RepID=A0A0B7BLP0_9EUPU
MLKYTGISSMVTKLRHLRWLDLQHYLVWQKLTSDKKIWTILYKEKCLTGLQCASEHDTVNFAATYIQNSSMAIQPCIRAHKTAEHILQNYPEYNVQRQTHRPSEIAL